MSVLLAPVASAQDLAHEPHGVVRRAPTAPIRPFMVVAWDEVFLAFNDTRFGQRAGFDQNRLPAP
ncbi:MAG: hypothetical protein Q8L48_01080 [Archangium sp.]|nr:hypothetical protein [Archangium sp.]